MSHINRSSFVKAILTQSYIQENINIESLQMALLTKAEGIPFVTKLAVMSMIFENAIGSIDQKIKAIDESFDKILSIVSEHKLVLPEEECMIEKVIKDLQEEGEGAVVSAPTNSVSGIEPTTPRISPKKKKEVEDVISRD